MIFIQKIVHKWYKDNLIRFCLKVVADLKKILTDFLNNIIVVIFCQYFAYIQISVIKVRRKFIMDILEIGIVGNGFCPRRP